VALSSVSPKKGSWISRRLGSFRHAGRGLWLLIASQWNFRIHLFAAAVAVALAAFFHFALFEWLVLLITIALVLVAEAINTALERTNDLRQPSVDPIARDAKDLAAAAVLLSAIAALIVGVALFAPKLWHLLAPSS
jgi:diacylglycerol kinase